MSSKIRSTKVVLASLLVCLAAICVAAQTPSIVETHYDEKKNATTLKVGPITLAIDKERYRSIEFSLLHEYTGRTPTESPDSIKFELVTLVKARRLNSDLHVVFLIDGRQVHFSSNRSAVQNPVPGRRWIGERMIFLMPYAEFVRLTNAQKLALKMGGVVIGFNDEAKAVLKRFHDEVIPH